MNKYEEEHLSRILDEIIELEEKEPDIVEEKKAYYLYCSLGQIYSYNMNYKLADAMNEEEYNRKIELYNQGTDENGEAICIDMNKAFKEGLNRLGIEAKLSYTDILNPLSHADVSFKCKNGKWYFANLTSDIMHIKTGMKVRNFGISQERLRQILYSDKPGRNKLYHLYRMNRENEGKEFTSIPEKQLKVWDDEFGYTYKGLYTNDVIDMLSKESLDDEFVREFFGTDESDEIVQKKLEYIMNYIKIINVTGRKTIGDMEAQEYYIKIAMKMFSKEEREKYIDFCMAFENVDGKREARNIVVVKKNSENVYYLYNKEKQIYDEISKEQLIKLPIKHHNIRRQRIENIKEVVQHFEYRFSKDDDISR